MADSPPCRDPTDDVEVSLHAARVRGGGENRDVFDARRPTG